MQTQTPTPTPHRLSSIGPLSANSEKPPPMTDSSASSDDQQFVPVPHGGPVYISDMVGPLTTIPKFRSSLETELRDLSDELLSSDLELIEPEPEISVHELKTLTEEELVDIAFEASFKNNNDVFGTNDDDTRGTNSSASSENQQSNDDRKRGDEAKRKKRRKKATRRDECCIETEVQKLTRIKQQQEEDKSAARLHSFNGANVVANGIKTVACVTPTPFTDKKEERLLSFKCTNSASTNVRIATGAREQISVHDSEILFCVEVFHSRRNWVKTQEILVLGQQLLTEMRDKIHCLTDEIMKSAGQDDSSGYFLIEDIFYNDLRDASATDYSRPILDWLKESEKDASEKWECIISGELQKKQKELLGCGNAQRLPQLRSLPMQATRFCDLYFRLGAGYLYCHQGDCKHVIVIRDMRLVHPDDVQNRAAYPLVVFQSKLRFQKCYVCKIYKAKLVTVNDKGAPDNPCYFCETCYYMLHYDDGKLIYDDFEVYDYLYE